MATASTQNMPEPSHRQKKWEQELTNNVICPDCKEDPADLTELPHTGDVVCNSCGLVVGDRVIDTGSEWRTFSNDDQGNDDPSRVGDAESILLNGNQLHTTISFGNGGNASRELYRAQNKSINDKANQNLLAAYKQIGALCDGWGMARNVSDTAKYLFKQVDDAKVLKGKSQDAIIAGCILIACRQHKVARTFKEIYALTKVPKKDIGRTFKQLEKFFYSLNIKNMQQAEENNVPFPEEYKGATASGAPELCLRYCDQLGLPFNITRISQAIAEKTSTIGALAGRSPLSTASACIYMASYLMGQGKTAKEISAVAGVSDGTIRTAYKFLIAKKDEIINPEWIKDGKGNLDNLPPS
jgi:transcription initiation factor TFIIB